MLSGGNLTLEELNNMLDLAKGEFKGFGETEDELKIELKDTNRPDLWSAEGIARQIRIKNSQEGKFFLKKKPTKKIIVDKSLKNIRPYIGAFIVRNIKIDEILLVQTIQAMEKLSENFGSKRRTIAVGIYKLKNINFPINYTTAANKFSFIPLGFEKKLTLKEILTEHPKGRQYQYILKEFKNYPILLDSKKQVLSFPPIINSQGVGEIEVGDNEFFVEATGTDINTLNLVINILAVNFADRGAEIEPIEIKFPYDTPLGKKQVCPHIPATKISLSVGQVRQLLGVENLKAEHIKKRLDEYGCPVEIRGDTITVTQPCYRQDYMHPVDVVEDFAISEGYNSFKPEGSICFSVGKLTDITLLEDMARDRMLAFGFEEVISNILVRHDMIGKKMEQKAPFIEIENIMTESYSAVRNYIIPSLLRVERDSTKSLYPHKIFETGEVALLSGGENPGAVSRINLAALIASSDANFSKLYGFLSTLLSSFNIKDYKLVSCDYPFCIPGRSAETLINKEKIGIIGEINPKVLENWDIKYPCVCFELNLDKLLEIIKTEDRNI
jgi:phenylalanyl-tRNA synthetase beta chain